MPTSRRILARLRAPRLNVRTSIAIFGTMVIMSGGLSIALTYEANARAARTASEHLAGSRRLFAELESRRARELVLQSTAITGNPAMLAALGQAATDGIGRPSLERELTRLAEQMSVSAIAVSAPDGTILASGGASRGWWLAGEPVRLDGVMLGGNGNERVERRAHGVFRVIALPLKRDDVPLGELHLATALDDAYASALARYARADVALMLNHEVLGSTLEPAMRAGLAAHVGDLPELGVLEVAGMRHALKCALYLGPIRFYVTSPVDAATGGLGGASGGTLALLGLGALALGGVVSVGLARSIATPIDRLSSQLLQMARARDFSRQLPPTGSSPELDGLTETFNQMMSALSASESQRELAYVGAIKALAAALDCRDPYTAGHSERVSTLAVMTGRHMGVDPEELEVLRLGALLHDIGKIGIRDNVLTKAGPLTREEFDIIKMHPTLGAHILRQVPFLHRHLPIVELHHERPDGRGYPHGLIGNATPLLARIVHVADAFDAMTSARAYRPAQDAAHAIAELWHYAGSQFDAEIVEAFVAAWKTSVATAESTGQRPMAVVPYSATRATGTEG